MGSSDVEKVCCEHCDRAYTWQEKYAGKKVRCKCGQSMRFPKTPPGDDGLDLELNLESGLDLNMAASLEAPVKTPAGTSNISPASSTDGSICPSCNATGRAGAVICISCGYNFTKGSKVDTNLGVQMAGGGTVYDYPMDGFLGQFKRSWAFAKISYGMIWDFKQLLLFPIFSSIAALLVLLSFAIPYGMWKLDQNPNEAGNAQIQIAETQTPAQIVWTPEQQVQLDTTRKALADSGEFSPQQIDEQMTVMEQSLTSTSNSVTASKDQDGGGQESFGAVDYLVCFAFYFCNFFVIAFFNTGLIACAMKIVVGEVPSVGYGIKVAIKRLPQIFAWAFISAVLGVLLKIIESKFKKFGYLVALILGTAWTVMTYFVMPVIAVEGVGPVKAIGKSGKVFKETWGELAAGNFSMAMMAFLVTLPLYLVLLVSFYWVVSVGASLPVIVILVSVILTFTFLLAVTTSAADTVFKALLYNFASGNALPAGIDTQAISSAFAQSRKRGVIGND